MLQLSDIEVSHQHVLHERDLLEEQLRKLKKGMCQSKIKCSLTGITVSSIEEMEHLQRVEHEKRDSAEKLACLQRATQRSAKEADCEKRHLQVQEYRSINGMSAGISFIVSKATLYHRYPWLG